MEDLYGVPLGKIDKKTAWMIVFICLVIVPAVLFAAAAYYKHGSLSKGWEDFTQQLSGTNDGSPLMLNLSGTEINVMEICHSAGENGEIPISQVEWKNSSDAGGMSANPGVRSSHTVIGSLRSVIRLDCRTIPESDKYEKEKFIPIALQTDFLAKHDNFTSDIIYRLEYYGDSGEMILERTVSGLPTGFTYTAGSPIPISLPISTGRPFFKIPSKLVLTFLQANLDKPSTRYTRTEPIAPPFQGSWQEIPSRRNAFNAFDSSHILFRELESQKAVTEYTNSEAMMQIGSLHQKFKTSYNYLVYTEWEIQNTADTAIHHLILGIEFLDPEGNVVDSSNTLNLWLSDHSLYIPSQGKWGFGKIWAFSDKATWEKVASYRIYVARLRRH